VSFWSKIKEAHRTTIEGVAIQMLQQNYTALVNLGMSLPPDRAEETTKKFVALAIELKPHFSNWSESGLLEMSKRISNDARSDQHVDRSSAIAKGLVAVWVECHARKGVEADLIRSALDSLIAAETAADSPPNARERSNPTNDLLKMIEGSLTHDVSQDVSYGYEPHDPILCRDIVSSKAYLNMLRHEGVGVTCDRQGSFMGPSNRVLDEYSISDSEGPITTLYVDAHAGPSASWKAPYGFTLAGV